MALPDARMSLTLAVGAEVFYRRAEALFKNTAEANCIPDVTVVRNIVAVPIDAAFFAAADGAVHVDLFLHLKFHVVGIPMEDDAARLRMRLNATTVNGDDQTIALALSYDSLILPGAPALSPQDQQELRSSLEAALEAATMTISFAPLLPDGRSIVGEPEFLIAAPNPQGRGKTLVVAIEVEEDSDVDRTAFRGAFAVDPLTGSSSAWMLAVDSALVRSRIEESLAETDFTQDADGGIPNWIYTVDTRALWTGEPLTGNLYFQQPYIEAHYDEHPIWFFLDGFYANFSIGGALQVYAAGYADLTVDHDARAIVLVPTVYAVGWGVVPLPLPDDPIESRPIADAEVADRLLTTAIETDPHRLTIRGIDEHPGEPGHPAIVAPASLEVRHVPASRRGCRTVPASGTLRADGSAFASFSIRNEGSAPLWICSLRCESDGDRFSIELPPSIVGDGFPFVVAPGTEVPIGVRLAGVDHEAHVGMLLIRNNDFDHPLVEVALSGQIEAPRDPALFEAAPCFRKPELIPPQEWFLGISEIVGRLGDLVRPGVESRHELEITIHGLMAADVVDVLTSDGRWLGTAMHLGSARHVALRTTDRPDGQSGRQPDHQIGHQLVTNSTARSLRLHLSVSDLRSVGEHRLDGPVNAALARGQHLFVAGREVISVLSIADPGDCRRCASIELPAVTSMALRGDWLVAETEGATEVFTVDDPWRPVRVHRTKTPSDRVRVDDDALLVESDGMRRLYTRGTDGGLRLDAELKAGAAPPRTFAELGIGVRGRDPSWGDAPYMPAGRIAHDRHVIEIVGDAAAPTVRIFEKAPSAIVFDVRAVERLLSARSSARGSGRTPTVEHPIGIATPPRGHR